MGKDELEKKMLVCIHFLSAINDQIFFNIFFLVKSVENFALIHIVHWYVLKAQILFRY